MPRWVKVGRRWQLADEIHVNDHAEEG